MTDTNTRTCSVCSKTFEQRAGRGRPAVYCHHSCERHSRKIRKRASRAQANAGYICPWPRGGLHYETR